MLSFLLIFLGLVFVARRYSQLPIGRALHAALIEAPASWLSGTPPMRIAILFVLVAGATLALAELIPLLVASDYALIPWLVDMSVYLDAIGMAWVAATAIRLTSACYGISGLLQRALRGNSTRPRARPRSYRRRRPKGPPPAKEDAPGFVLRVASRVFNEFAPLLAGPSARPLKTV
jgi:hypothetical protein